ncbi:MAG TPA: SbcC/MukB-like Walker B domain-containing protein [Halothiobacillus sp.]|nr:SbcC/MukB-like Walker B domain-containing protein [Halothiobacillus sp.]
MKYLESVKLVQYFLIDKANIEIKEITGIFGPNASGKSSLLDAVQIAMFGANSRLVSLNAQADERTMTRTLRSSCLGITDETRRARDHATTYITLVWRDTETGEPLSMGVCIYASIDKETHEVRGRYILPGIELALKDHLEEVDNEERPRAWETFRVSIIEQAKVSGVEPLYTDSERYIKQALLSLRGSGGVPSAEAFKVAFRFALRMRFDKSVDHIVRNDVLEARSTNIQKFKDVTDTFRMLAETVAQVEAKIEDGERVEVEFAKADKAARHAATWEGLSHLVTREETSEAMNRATEAKQEADQTLLSLNERFKLADEELSRAKAEESTHRERRINHSAHKEHGALQSDIIKYTDTAGRKKQDIVNSINLVRNTLRQAARSEHLQNNAPAIELVAMPLEALASNTDNLNRESLPAVMSPALKEAAHAWSELFKISGSIEHNLTEANALLKDNQNALTRAKEGRPQLSTETQRLLTELRNNGLNPTPVCDLVRVTDPEWQPVIETYLGRAVEALLVEKKDEAAAFKIYRSKQIYGPKVAMESRQNLNLVAAPGTVAELIEGDHPAAVAYLRRRFGDTLRATSDAEALAGQRTLTKDGMFVQPGDFDRQRLVEKSKLRIGSGDMGQKDVLLREIARLQGVISTLNKQAEEVKVLSASLKNIASESMVMQFILGALDDMNEAQSNVTSSRQRLAKSGDAEYVRLGEAEQAWKDKVKELEPAVAQLREDIGKASATCAQVAKLEADAVNFWQQATAAADVASSNKDYDRDYASLQWDVLLDKFADRYPEMKAHSIQQQRDFALKMNNAIQKGARELGTFKEKYREQGAVNADDWRLEREWICDVLTRLRDTELRNYTAEMNNAYKASQETFRTDVAIALSNNLDWLNRTMDRLNNVLKKCPVFSNGERYQFRRTVRPQLQKLLTFVQDVAAHGPNDDLLGGPGEIPEEFKQLLDEKTAPGAAGVRSPLDDYREFFEFDIEILREDPVTKTSQRVGVLSKRLGTGSGGEHRAPLYVIAGAALASAYHLDASNNDGLRLILLDEAFNKMDIGNIIATMRYLEQLGLQVFMASPGENLGTLTAFLHRYYDILRDVENNIIMLDGHAITEETREEFKSDLPEFNDALVEQEILQARLKKTTTAEVAA